MAIAAQHAVGRLLIDGFWFGDVSRRTAKERTANVKITATGAAAIPTKIGL